MIPRGDKKLWWTLFTTTRQLMTLWYTIQIPSGIALFTAVFHHIGAVLYYSTFLRQGV
jgi:hypothetical protein